MIKRFLNYVEIKTKITSTFAFLLTLAFLFYSSQPIKWGLTLMFFGAMFLFDLTTTAINNYIDTKTNEQVLPFKRSIALLIILVLLGSSTLLGLLLVYQTDIVVLLLGGLCFLCGILYTYGPVPISRQPWGEILSGIFYGFFIPFILLYMNMPEGTYISLQWNLKTISLELQILPLITLALLAVIPVCTTANIMLANNICDVEKDILVKRYTLPYYLGKKTSLYLFAAIYYCTYAAVLVMTAAGILPVVSLLFLVTLIPVQKNINQFFRVQDKEKTFIVAIKNYVIIMGAISLLIFLGGLLR
ncbi:UbiA family prenyltransferase [Aminipila butyrica]|uniref:UbiA family prenyltransferase n=1 Tax=Aminipila butyrica TaxID=433296 RepID=A0A858BXA1_9FIRM|nr:UbiA family prenyltransferase [Aminipila butyrica]QIB70042.1 UbiA family prenyltransferase [Aminipila butyrica]